jgi:hypothetical protein
MIFSQTLCCLFGKLPPPPATQPQGKPLLQSPANAMSGDEVHAMLQRYGVGGLLTPQDDPIFWATVLQNFWPVKELVADAAHAIPPIYFFGIKECSDGTTLEWGNVPRPNHRRLTSSADGQLREQKSESADGQEHPGFSLDVGRPSVGVRSAWFENRRQFGLTHGNSETGLCFRTPKGIWSEPKGLERSRS